MSPSATAAHTPRAPAVLTTVLGVAAGLAVAVGCIGGLFVLLSAQGDGPIPTGRLVLSVGCVFAGVAVGCLLWAAGHLVRRRGREALLQASAERTIQQRQAAAAAVPAGGSQPSASVPPAASGPPPIAPAAAGGGTGGTVEQQLLREILAQLKELNESLLLTVEQRQAKHTDRRKKLSRRFVRQIEQAIDSGDFVTAERQIAAFAEELPDDLDPKKLAARLVEARDGAKLAEIKARTREVCDLMAVSAFDRAESAAAELHGKYPDEPGPAELLRRVRREAATFTEERRERLYKEVVRLAEARQWRSALTAAREFVEAFPEGVNADAIRAMMTTMEDNARIEEVREIRDHIRDLIERRRYGEAVEAAQDVIRRFPDTRAAGELKYQLGRLRELARSPGGNGPTRS